MANESLTIRCSDSNSSLQLIVGICMTLINLLGNTFLVVVTLQAKDIYFTTKIVMIFQGISNLIVGVFVLLPLTTALTTNGWLLGDIYCAFYAYGINTWLLLCMFSGMCFNYDRYTFLTKPLKYYSLVTTRRTSFSVLGACILALSVSLPDGFICNWSAEWRCDYHTCVFIPTSDMKSNWLLGLTILRSSLIAVPITATVLSFIRVRILATIQVRKTRNTLTEGQENTYPKAKTRIHFKSLKPMILLSIFVIPSAFVFMFNSVYMCLKLTLIHRNAHFIVTIVSFVCTCPLVFIHYAINVPFRTAAHSMLSRRR